MGKGSFIKASMETAASVYRIVQTYEKYAPDLDRARLAVGKEAWKHKNPNAKSHFKSNRSAIPKGSMTPDALVRNGLHTQPSLLALDEKYPGELKLLAAFPEKFNQEMRSKRSDNSYDENTGGYRYDKTKASYYKRKIKQEPIDENVAEQSDDEPVLESKTASIVEENTSTFSPKQEPLHQGLNPQPVIYEQNDAERMFAYDQIPAETLESLSFLPNPESEHLSFVSQ